MSSNSTLEALYQEDIYLLRSRTLVVLDKPWDHLTEADQTLLAKILGAVRLTLAGVQIISSEHVSDTLIKTFRPDRVIIFGSTFENLRRYEHVTRDGVSIVLADSLNELDDLRKKNLWGALKQMLAT
jgi:ABC-type cobalamin transport system ATPase subunit